MNKEFYKKNIEAAAGRLISMGQALIDEGQRLMRETKHVTVSVITRFYNDEMIAPYFLEHYSWADEIIVLLSDDTTDRSREIIARYPHARAEAYALPGGVFNCREASLVMQKKYEETWSDWIICVDADELVFPKSNAAPREVLARADGNLIYADMWQVYRHREEMDLDPTLKAIWLRRHGDPNRTKGDNARYCKPIIARPGLGIKWGVGFHNYEPQEKIKVSATRFDGAHWRMADPALALARRLRGRRENVAKENILKGWSADNHDVTADKILAECEKHLDDPQLF